MVVAFPKMTQTRPPCVRPAAVANESDAMMSSLPVAVDVAAWHGAEGVDGLERRIDGEPARAERVEVNRRVGAVAEDDVRPADLRRPAVGVGVGEQVVARAGVVVDIARVADKLQVEARFLPGDERHGVGHADRAGLGGEGGRAARSQEGRRTHEGAAEGGHEPSLSDISEYLAIFLTIANVNARRTPKNSTINVGNHEVSTGLKIAC